MQHINHSDSLKRMVEMESTTMNTQDSLTH